MGFQIHYMEFLVYARIVIGRSTGVIYKGFEKDMAVVSEDRPLEPHRTPWMVGSSRLPHAEHQLTMQGWSKANWRLQRKEIPPPPTPPQQRGRGPLGMPPTHPPTFSSLAMFPGLRCGRCSKSAGCPMANLTHQSRDQALTPLGPL